MQTVYEIKISQIVQNNTSKCNLLVFLCGIWSHSFDAIPANTNIFLSGGFISRLNMKVVSFEGETECPNTSNKYTRRGRQQNIHVIQSSIDLASCHCCFDTDSVVIVMYVLAHFRQDGILELFILTKDQAKPIHSLLP